MNLRNLLAAYDYPLPKELIAQKPARPRDRARLLIYGRKNKKTIFDIFANLAKYLPPKAVLVFNQTKVLPARLSVLKPGGGEAEVLYLEHNKHDIKVLSNKTLKTGSNITATYKGKRLGHLQFWVIKKAKGIYTLKPKFAPARIKSILTKYGQTPLPPYIKNSPLNEKQRRLQYQTVFAKAGLSVAAPTASLHFTKKLISRLKKRGIGVEFIRLDVNLGTFAPLKEDNFKTGKLHRETYYINPKVAKRLNFFKQQGRPVIAVGTTVVRTLESASCRGLMKKLSGNTKLFIRPGFKFQFIDGLITNFHVPKSSLLMLVAALIKRRELWEIYRTAIKKKIMFFSFGDGMLIF